MISATDDNQIRAYLDSGEHYLFCRPPVVQLDRCGASGARELPHNLFEQCPRFNCLICERRCPFLEGDHLLGRVNDRNEMNGRTASGCNILGMNECVAAVR